jgi:probable rRNA maturation factor
LPSARVLARFLAEAQAAVRLRGEVTVLLTTDSAIRSLNRRFRGKNRATDVLSFPADRSAEGAQTIAGDLAVSVPTAQRQGTACGHSLAIELKVLILHGLLHLAGYDHETDAGRMARRERLLRGRLGLPEGLIERAETPARAAGKTRKNGAGRFVLSQARRKNRDAPSLGHPASLSGAKAPTVLSKPMYGLKPVPFTPAPFTPVPSSTSGMRKRSDKAGRRAKKP